MPTATLAPVWGFLGLFAGGWKLALVAAGVVALFGGRLRPFASRWLSPVARGSAAPRPDVGPARPWFHDRLYILLLVVAASAVATWIIARMVMTATVHSPG